MKEQTGRMTHRLHVKITAFLLVFAMACTAMASLPMEVFAADNVVGGTFGDNLTWELDKSTGVLTISGNGSMPATNYGAAWYSYRSYIRTVVIEDGITSVGENNFFEYLAINEVRLPDSLTTIESSAFYRCKYLKSVQFANSNISNTSKHIVFESSCFSGCTSLESFTIPEGTTRIGGRAFEGCGKLTNVYIPDSVTIIQGNAFMSCPIRNAIIPKGVTQIGQSAFEGSRYISVSSENEYYSSSDGVLFNKDKSKLLIFPNNDDSVYDIPDTVTTVAEAAFEGCENLCDVPKSKNVSVIWTWTYSRCMGLKNINIPYSIKTIRYFAFFNCNNLESVAIPNSVEEIHEWAFENCDNLKKIYADKGTTGYDFAIANNIDVEPFNAANSVTNYEVLELDKSTLQLYVNRSVTLNAAINNKIVSNQVLTWSSGDDSIAKVSKSGKVTGVKDGKTTIYAKTANGYLAKCEVTVKTYAQSYSIKSSDFNFGPKSAETVRTMQVDFLGKKFNLLNLDVGYNVDLKYVSCNYDEVQQKLSVKIGKLKDYNDETFEDDKLWREEYNEIKDFYNFFNKKTTTTQEWEKFSKFRKKLKDHKLKFGFDFDSAVYGYIEFDCSSGEPRFCEGGLAISSTTSISYKYYPVPIFFAKISLKGELAVKCGMKYQQVGNSDPKISVKLAVDFSLIPELSAGAEVGVGKFEIVSITAGYRGKFNTSLSNGDFFGQNDDSKTDLSIKYQGSIFLEAKALGFTTSKWENYYNTGYQIYPQSKTKSASLKKAASAQDNTAAANDFTLVPRTQKTSRKSVAPKNYKTAVGQNLVSNVYPYSEPQMLQLSGDKVLAVWVDDDTSRSDINRTALMYTYYNGSEWSTIQQVNNDGTPDYSPKLIRHGDGAYLVWQNADEPLTDGMTMLDTAAHYNIAVAYFDGNSFGEVRNVNDYDNSILEVQPLLISDGSNLTSVWVEATDNYVYGDQTVFTLCKATVNESEVTPSDHKKIIIAENISDLSAIDAAFFNGDEYILYSTSESDDIHLFKNGTETTLTGMSSNFRIVDGKLYWFTDSGVKFAPLDDLDSVTDTAIAFSGNAGNIQFLHNSNGGRAIIWKQTEDLKSELFVSYYDTVSKAWGQGIQITNCNAAIADYTAMLDNENKISYIIETREVLDGDEYPYGTANLVMNSYTKVTDIKTDGIYYNSTEIVPNGTVEFSTGIVNVGTETVSSVTVELLDASDNVIGTAAYEEPILSGESADVAISTTLPADLASFGVKMRVTTQGDVDTSNNTTEITRFALPNIVLDNPNVTDTTADGAQIKVNISNEGFADANAVTVNLYQDNTDTEPIATQTIEGLAKDGSSEVTFSVSRDLLTENEYPYLNQFVVSASIEEDELLYIDNTQVCQVESMRVTGVNFAESSVELRQLTTKQLTATITPSTAIDKGLTWLSTNTDVVTVDENGMITAVSAGQAKIMVVTSDGGFTAECEINVKPTELQISESEATLIIGDTKKLTVTLNDKDFTEGTWSSSDETVATVSEDGTVTAVAIGTATVQFTAYNETLREISCEVTVEAPPITFTASPDSPQKIGTPVTLTATGGSSYRFYCEQNGKWVNIRNYAAENTCVWTPTVPKEYTIYVDIKDDSGKLVATRRIQYIAADKYFFTLDKSNEQNVGAKLTLTAEGGSSYKFYYEYNGVWCSITSNSTGVCEWSPKFAGNYMLYVDIKDETGKVIACRTQAFKLNDPFSLTSDVQSTELPYGKTIHFTAEGGTSYKFYYEKQGEWVRVQDFSAVNTCAWTPTAAGTYNFYCDIKDASGAVVSCKRMTFNITNPYSLTADKATTQSVGTKITFTATGGYQYKFYYEKDGSWVRIQSFSTANICSWTPTVAGRYNVYCDIADENGTVLAYKGMEFVIGDAGADEYSFTTSAESPQPMNTAVTLTATGGTSYKFYYEVGGKWATIKNFSTANTATWTPDMIADYTLYVDIKNSSGKVVKTLSKKFSATDPYSFTADVTSPQNIGKSVKLTATGGTSYKFYYQYSGAWVKIQDSASATCNWKPNKAGEYMVYVDIKNASGAVVTCRTMKLVFNDPYRFTTSASSLMQPAGTAISLSANGGASYKFYYEKDGAWIRIQDYSTTKTCTWTPTEAGKYNVFCDIKDASGSVAVCKRITFTITEKCAIAASKTTASVGDTITFTATGGSSYKFYYEKDGAWVRIQSFSTSNTCNWKPTAAGDYVVYVDVNDQSGNLIGCKGVRCVVG